ncbi:hypothetical protein GGX14DRAFT_524825 [Mycena pura]|uniref:DUF3533 domain-containing protein n=1 Tax=Mycena pura TaxID=153505 RepID=A0AAD6V1W3_9AGAR|nr:hypothetical protein GGX14DRAFT_524825 [Mycena pura]
MPDSEKLARTVSDTTSERTEGSTAAADAPAAPPEMCCMDKTAAATAARAIYIKSIARGVVLLALVIFGVLSIYWGSVWSTPAHTLPAWVVDFDGGIIGQGVAQALSASDPGRGGVSWEVVQASQFPGGISQLEDAILHEKTWYGLAVHPGATANLMAAIASADATYNSSTAMTFIATEARNENIYRLHIRMVTPQLDSISRALALQLAKNISTLGNISAPLSTAPQVVTAPVGYTVANIRPFDVPVASAVTFVGLIYMLILANFIVLIAAGARDVAGYDTRLTLGSLFRVRILTAVGAYFFLALFYTLLSRAFQLPLNRRFGDAGFVIFWMLNWVGMLACGLALEAMLTLLTPRFVPFFLIVWIVTNVSVCVYPLQVLPHIYRYGYGFPFYNISRAVRTIVFGTKNDVGMNFGILIAWIALSCMTMPLFQWLVRRRKNAVARSPN